MVIIKPLSIFLYGNKLTVSFMRTCNFGVCKPQFWCLPVCSCKRYLSATVKFNSADISSNGPVSELSKKITNGELSPDEHQQRIAEELQRVYNEIKNYSPPVDSIFSKLFSKKAKKKSPKGLYIYGAVGGGKTMLMDLFHNCFEVRKSVLYLPV